LPKIIRNPLREGLTSKIYLLAYNGPITGYKIAEKINGKSVGSVPQTAKIYAAANSLMDGGLRGMILEKTEKGYCSLTPSPSSILLDLSELECHMLDKVLDSDYFRSQVERSFFYKKDFFKGDVDALRQITEVLGLEAIFAYVYSSKKFEHDFKTKEEFDNHWNKYVVGEKMPRELLEHPKVKEYNVRWALEEEYFKKNGYFKQGGLFEDEKREGRMAIDGKEIKQWGGPSNLYHISYSLIKKLCQLSQIYTLFQSTDNLKELFELWSKKRIEDVHNSSK
jgi:hypothetical protein